MEQTNNRKLVASAVLIVASVALLLGLTFAWFTDSVVNKGNKIQAGTLQLSAVSQALDMENGATVVADSAQVLGKGTELKFGAGTDLKEASSPIIDDALWEPGISNAKLLTVSSGESSLSMKVKLSLTAQGDLTDALWFDFVRVEGGAVTGRFDPCTWDELLAKADAMEFVLNPGDSAQFMLVYGMNEAAGNEFQGTSFEADVALVATQAAVEADGFGSADYDADAAYAWDGVTTTEVVPDENGVYRISTGSDLAWIAQAVADDTLQKGPSGAGVAIELQADIDLGGNAWTPIGGENAFTGTFDGKGHAIRNLAASSNPSSSDPTRGVALFGYAENAAIKNLRIENCDLQGRYATSAVVGDGCAPLAFENIEVASGSIRSNQDVGSKRGMVAGGILGQGWGPNGSSITFENCINRADVSVSKWHAGGIWGSITVDDSEQVDVISLVDCANYGSITVAGTEKDDGFAGGLGAFAYAKSCVVEGCANHGSVTAPAHLSEFVASFNDAPINENTV